MGLYDYMYLVPRDEYLASKKKAEDGVNTGGDVLDSTVNNIEVTSGGTVVVGGGGGAAAGVDGGRKVATGRPDRSLTPYPRGAGSRGGGGGGGNLDRFDPDPGDHLDSLTGGRLARARAKQFAQPSKDVLGEKEAVQVSSADPDAMETEPLPPTKGPFFKAAASSKLLTAAGKPGTAMRAAATGVRGFAPKRPTGKPTPMDIDDQSVGEALAAPPPRVVPRTGKTAAVRAAAKKDSPRSVMDQLMRNRLQELQMKVLPPSKVATKAGKSQARLAEASKGKKSSVLPSVTAEQLNSAQTQKVLHELRDIHKEEMRMSAAKKYLPAARGQAIKRQHEEDNEAGSPGTKFPYTRRLPAGYRPPVSIRGVKRGVGHVDGEHYHHEEDRVSKRRTPRGAVRMGVTPLTARKRSAAALVSDEEEEYDHPAKRPSRSRRGEAVRIQLPPSQVQKRGRAGEEGLVFGPPGYLRKKARRGPSPPRRRQVTKRKAVDPLTYEEEEEEEARGVMDAMLDHVEGDDVEGEDFGEIIAREELKGLRKQIKDEP